MANPYDEQPVVNWSKLMFLIGNLSFILRVAVEVLRAVRALRNGRCDTSGPSAGEQSG